MGKPVKFLQEIPRNKLTNSKYKELKNKVGRYLLEQIKKDSERGISSESGKKWKTSLDPQYAKRKQSKGGAGKADLRLTGDMVSSLTAKNKRNGVETGVYKSKEADKADGHCNHSGKSKLPLRRFVPLVRFRKGIRENVKKIIEEFIDQESKNDEG